MKTQLKIIVTAGVLIFTAIAEAKSSNFKDVSYSFDTEKNKAAKDSFHFLRSYVDYFFLLVNQNKSDLKAFNQVASFSGWCVGDAHAENFGALVQKDQTTVFTVNDMDDFGPCPVGFDLYRLMVSSKLYDKNIDLDQIAKNYILGLKNSSVEMPDCIKKLIDKSINKGLEVSAKKISSNKIIRDSIMTEVGASDEQQILNGLNQQDLGLSKNYKIIDLVSTHKIGGGSGGLFRYEVLISDHDKLIHLELKEEEKPSIYPVLADRKSVV